jgi:coatomer subunit alpha
MSVQFHNEDNLLLSASLDYKIFVWDYSELKEKHQKYSGDAKGRKVEMFTGVEVEVKNICEGHEKGVNFASFHPTRSLIASGADDKLIKLWRMSGARAWEMDTLRGHQNNVSCVEFHPKLDILISNSEDRTMKIWDLNRRTCIYTLKKEVDRFWIIATHPTNNYFACGYDRGMAIFKLESEKFASQRLGNQLFYVKNKVLTIEDLSSMESIPQANLEVEGKQVLNNQPKTLYYNIFNPSSHDIIWNYPGEEGNSILVILNKNINKNNNVVQRKIDATKGAVFIAKEKLCVLSKNKSLFIYLFDGRNKKIEWAPKTPIQQIFQATIGKVLIKSNDDILMFDIAARKIVSDMQFSNLSKVYWSENQTLVALCSKNTITIWDKNLKPICIAKESGKFKSGCFDHDNGFIYSTAAHIKYLIVKKATANESSHISGIFKSIDNPVYVSGFAHNTVFYITREGKVVQEKVNTAEYELKVALKRKKINDVIKILKKGQLSGNSVIQYLKEENCADIALLFEKDPKTRFSLALSSGNIQEAYKNATEIKEKDTYLQLASNSLDQGYFNVAEKSYQSIKAFNKLSFFYSAQGCTSKLQKMQSIALELNSKNDAFENSLMLGTIRERVKILMQSGQLALAYASAKAHNLTDLIPVIEEEIRNKEVRFVDDFDSQVKRKAQKAKSLLPWRPVFVENEEFTTLNWPHTMLVQSNVEQKMGEAAPEEQNVGDILSDVRDNKLTEDLLKFDDEDFPKNEGIDDFAVDADIDGDKWGDEIQLDDDEILGDIGGEEAGDPDLADLDKEVNQQETEFFVPPSKSNDPMNQIVANSMIPAHHIAIGNFKEALDLLRKQIGLANPRPLRNIFAFLNSNSKIWIPTLPKLPSIRAILRSQDGSVPVSIINHEFLKKLYKIGFTETTQGNFKDSLIAFQKWVQYAALSTASNSDEEKEIRKLISSWVEYILAMRIELKRRDKALTKTEEENWELAWLMTIWKLHPSHQFLALKNAMNLCYKAQNFITAAHLARSILDLESKGVSRFNNSKLDV